MNSTGIRSEWSSGNEPATRRWVVEIVNRPFLSPRTHPSLLAETAIRMTDRAFIVLCNVPVVSRAGRYTVRMAISAHDCYDVTVEDLPPALLALMLTGTTSHCVHVANRTLHVPGSIQTSPGRSRKSQTGTERSNRLRQSRNEVPSLTIHIISCVVGPIHRVRSQASCTALVLGSSDHTCCRSC
jgi:hypothetical protein